MVSALLLFYVERFYVKQTTDVKCSFLLFAYFVLDTL